MARAGSPRCASCSRPTRSGPIRTACRPSKCRPRCCCRWWRRATVRCSREAERGGSMALHPLKHRVVALLEAAGLHVDGPGDCDPQVHGPHFYGRVVRQGSLGLGESYMDGGWTVRSLDGMLHRLLRHGIDQRVHGLASWADDLRAWALNLQSGQRALRVGEQHYEIGTALFEAMLGQRPVYIGGYWRAARTLDAAQASKHATSSRKPRLGPRPDESTEGKK